MVGGSRETTPSRPLLRMAGTKGEQPSQRLRGVGTQLRARRWQPGEGGATEPPPPPPRSLPSLPLSLTRATFFRRAPHTRCRWIGGHQRQVRSPQTPARRWRWRWRWGWSVGPSTVPLPLPKSSRSPPTPPASRPADAPRVWCGDTGGRGAPAGGSRRAPWGRGRGVGKPTLLASSLLRSIRARVRDSIRDIIPQWGEAAGTLGTPASSYCGDGGGRAAPHA